jgi:hypothetical protein
MAKIVATGAADRHFGKLSLQIKPLPSDDA